MGSQILASILQGVIWFLNIFTWLIIINALLSWIISPKHPIRIFIGRMVAPFLAPFRALTKGFRSPTFPIDFSPLFAYIALRIIIMLLERLRYMIMF